MANFTPVLSLSRPILPKHSLHLQALHALLHLCKFGLQPGVVLGRLFLRLLVLLHGVEGVLAAVRGGQQFLEQLLLAGEGEFLSFLVFFLLEEHLPGESERGLGELLDL